jgi:hypothetical protein
VQQVPIDLRTKDRVRQFDLADFLPFQIHHIYDRHGFFSLSIPLLPRFVS